MVMFDPAQQRYLEEQRQKEAAAKAAAEAQSTAVQQTQVAQTTGAYAAPPSGYYISGYQNGQPIYSPISGTGPVITPTAPEYPTQPTPETPTTPSYGSALGAAGSGDTDTLQDIADETPDVPQPTIPVTYTDGSSTFPTPTPVTSSTTPGEDALHERAAALRDKIQQQNIAEAQAVYDSALKDYSKSTDRLESKWDSLIQGDEFIGTKEEYEEYLKDWDELDKKSAKVDALAERLNRFIDRAGITSAEEEKRFLEKNVLMPDGKYYSKEEVAWQNKYKSSDSKTKFEMLLDGGYIERGSVYAGTDADGEPLFYTRDQAKALDTLNKFDNVYLAVKRGGLTASELKSLGFEQADIDHIIATVDTANRTRVALPGEKDYISKWNAEYAKAEDAFSKAADAIDARYPDKTNEERAELMKATPEYKALEELNQINPDAMATEITIAKRVIISGASTIAFSPARALLPEINAKDISGMEWAVGGAQIALLALPGVGLAARGATGAAAMAVRGAEIGIQTGAAVIFTKDTYDNWDELKKNPAQLAFSLAMDALIVGGALRSIAPKTVDKVLNNVSSIVNSQKGGTIPGTRVNAEGIPKGQTTSPTGKIGVTGTARQVDPLANSMNKAHNAIVAKDATMLRESARDMLNWAKLNADNPAAKTVERRAVDFLKNADDYVKLGDVKLQAKEGPVPREVIEARNKGVLGNTEIVNNLDDYLKAKESLKPAPPENPLSKQSIKARLDAKANVEAKIKAREQVQTELKSQYEIEARNKAFAEEIAKLKEQAANDPLSRQRIRERLKEKASLDAKSNAVTDAREKLKKAVDVERDAKTYADKMEWLKENAAQDAYSRQQVRESLKAKAKADAAIKASEDARNRLKAAVDSERKAAAAFDEIARLKESASANPLSKYSIREKLEIKARIDAKADAQVKARERIKERIDAERQLEALKEETARLKSQAAKDPLSRQSVRERMRIKNNIEANEKAIANARERLKAAVDAERDASAYANKMKHLKENAAQDAFSRQSVREKMRVKEQIDAQDKAIADAQERLRTAFDAEAKAKAEQELNQLIEKRARLEAEQRLLNERTVERGKGEISPDDEWPTYKEKLDDKPKTEPPAERGGGGERGETAVKERTETKTKTEEKTKTKVEQEADRIVEEKTKTDNKPTEKPKVKEDIKTKEETKPGTGEKSKVAPRPTPGQATPEPSPRPQPSERAKPKTTEAPAPADRPMVSPFVSPEQKPSYQPYDSPVTRQIAEPTPGPAPYPVPKPVPGPEPKPVPPPVPKPAPTPEPPPVEKPKPNPRERYKPFHPKPIKTTFKEKVKPRHKDETDEEKRRRIAQADTKVTWEQGKLKVKGEILPVHHVVMGIDGQYETTTVLGAKPEGAISAEGKGQSYKTVTVAKGIPPATSIALEGGAVDPVVSPSNDNGKRGVTIRFVKDKDIQRKQKDKMFTINRRSARSGRSVDLGADIIKDRKGRHLRL